MFIGELWRRPVIICLFFLTACCPPGVKPDSGEGVIIPPTGAFILLNTPRAANGGTAFLGRCILDGAPGPYATNRPPNIPTVSDQGLDKYTYIYNGTVGGNLKVGIVNLLNLSLGAGFSNGVTYELRDLQIIIPENDIYDVPFGECEKVITGVLVAGKLAAITTQGTNANAGVELEGALKQIADGSGVTVETKNNEYEATFGTGLALGIQVADVIRSEEVASYDVNAQLGETAFTPINDQDYGLVIDQILQMDPTGYGGQLTSPKDVYCLRLELTTLNIGSSDRTYCPRPQEVQNQRIREYNPSRLYTLKRNIAFLSNLDGDDTVVQTYLTVDSLRVLLTEDPNVIDEVVGNITLTERRYTARRAVSLEGTP